MADKSDIGWTGATWNVITGCKIKSPACRLCYAMDLAGTRLKNHPSRVGLTKVVNGMHVWTGEVRFNEDWLMQPLQWSKPREIFVVAHGDLFYEGVPDEWIDKTFAVMIRARWHTFQLLTKRSDRMRFYMNNENTPKRIATWIYKLELEIGNNLEYKTEATRGGSLTLRQWPPANVHGGVSTEDQKRADERIPDLLASPFAKRYVSAEPLLGRIDFEGRGWLIPNLTFKANRLEPPYLDQIITGGESGRGKRRPLPTHVDWLRIIRDQCARTDTAFFHKQNGSWIHGSQTDGFDRDVLVRADKHYWPDGTMSCLVGTGAAGMLLDGVTHEGRP